MLATKVGGFKDIFFLLVAGVTFIVGCRYAGKDMCLIYYLKVGMREVFALFRELGTPFSVSYAAAFRLSDALFTQLPKGGRALTWEARGGW